MFHIINESENNNQIGAKRSNWDPVQIMYTEYCVYCSNGQQPIFRHIFGANAHLWKKSEKSNIKKCFSQFISFNKSLVMCQCWCYRSWEMYPTATITKKNFFTGHKDWIKANVRKSKWQRRKEDNRKTHRTEW